MGVVYEAFDQQRRMKVALKTLLEVDPGTIYRFKNEFRALADVAHPNLVSLYELVSDHGIWFFTMELVDGVSFLSYVRGADTKPDAERDGTDTVPDDDKEATTQVTRIARTNTLTPRLNEPPPLDWTRLRNGLGQLAQGVHALHDSGHMHRDVKPSNVLVSPSGRVVLLDFGVITELAGARHQSDKVEVVGTPAYMAPEQARGEVTRASDWYSVGVMLYSALTGKRPFAGSSDAVLRAKQRAEAPPPGGARDDIPKDLERLCTELLRRDPEQRPTGTEILERLGVQASAGAHARRAHIQKHGGTAEPAELIGRSTHLNALHAAYNATKQGYGQTVLVHGSSGMGKTTLVDHFLANIASDEQAVILTGRCYEREQVPYKGVDSVIDSMCRYLMSLPEHEVDTITPRDVLMLSKVFPVLRRVEVFARARRRAVETPDPHEVRRRAFAALRDLLGRIAERRPLVLFIDDAQWGDADSAPLLDALMRPPDVPPLLLLLSYRSEDAERSPLLRSLRERDGVLAASDNAREIPVGALGDDHARHLATALLEGLEGGTDAALAIARESNGHPYFIHELARHAREQGIEDATELSLDVVISGRVSRLPERARRLMRVVAMAGKPIPQGVLGRAASSSPADRAVLINQLRVAELVRSSGARDNDLVECYHDRIRETVLGQIEDGAAEELHGRIAYAYQGAEHPDAETLVMHFVAAGERDAAAEYAIEAARKAEDALSFDRAAELYQLALELHAGTDDEQRELTVRLAEAMYHAGRGSDAALSFVEASRLATGFNALDLRRRAAEQYLQSGHLSEGIDMVRGVLRDVGLRYPSTPRRGILGLLLRRAQLWLRGLGFRERSRDDMSPMAVMPVDVCWSVATGLSQIDPARAGVFATRTVLLALKLGDPFRAVRALLLESAFQATAGSKTLRRSAQLSNRARQLMEHVEEPHLTALGTAMEGFVAVEQGNFTVSYEKCEQAVELLRGRPGVAWELGTMQLFSLVSLVYMGEFKRVRELAPERVASAQQRGDLYTATNIRCLISPSLWMMDDQPEMAIREAEDAIARWGGIEHGYHNQHFMALIMNAQADLHRGDARRAYQRWLDDEKPLKRSLLLFIQIIRGYYNYGRAIAGLAAASQNTGQIDLNTALEQANRCARRLEREKVTWALALAKLVRAVAAAASNNPEQTATQLRLAVAKFEEASMWLHAAAARRALGRLLSGSAGERLIKLSDDYADEHGAKCFDRVAKGLVPVSCK